MNKWMYGIAVFGALAASATPAFAGGDLVTNAIIDQIIVKNTSPAEAFSVTVSSGSGPCSNETIRFPATSSASTNDGMRSVAMAAFLAGKRVRIYSYATGAIDCGKADYIRIQN